MSEAYALQSTQGLRKDVQTYFCQFFIPRGPFRVELFRTVCLHQFAFVCFECSIYAGKFKFNPKRTHLFKQEPFLLASKKSIQSSDLSITGQVSISKQENNLKYPFFFSCLGQIHINELSDKRLSLLLTLLLNYFSFQNLYTYFPNLAKTFSSINLKFRMSSGCISMLIRVARQSLDCHQTVINCNQTIISQSSGVHKYLSHQIRIHQIVSLVTFQIKRLFSLGFTKDSFSVVIVGYQPITSL